MSECYLCFRKTKPKECLNISIVNIHYPVDFSLTLPDGTLFEKTVDDSFVEPFNQCIMAKKNTTISFLSAGLEQTYLVDENLKGVHCNIHIYIRKQFPCQIFGLEGIL